MNDLSEFSDSALLYELMCRMKENEVMTLDAWDSRVRVEHWKSPGVRVVGTVVERFVRVTGSAP